MRETTLTFVSTTAEGRSISIHAAPPTPFATNTIADGEHMVLSVCGELDIATAGQVRSAVHDLRRAGATSIMIDLRALEFTDSQGPHVLIDLQEEFHAGGDRMALIPGRATVQRVFDLTRTSPRLRWEDAA